MKLSYESGMLVLLQTALQGVALTGPFYVGLGTGAIPQTTASTLSNITEVAGTGYVRKAITRAVGGAGWTLTTLTFAGPNMVWTNSGIANWTSADYAFLTLSPTGTTAPTALFDCIEIAPFTLAAGGTQTVSFRKSF